ncbi:MAG: hypothetical protein ACP5O2_10540 [Bacteroidales bacterium]
MRNSFYTIVMELLKSQPLFIWDTDYVIINWESENEKTSSNIPFHKIDIEHIISITPLSEMAADFLRSRWDPRIWLTRPLDENLLREIRIENLKEERRKALKILWKILAISKPFEPILDELREMNLIEGLMRRIEPENTSAPSEKNYWSVVMAYDRHNHYPNDISGFFFDAGEVLARSIGADNNYSKTHYYMTLRAIIEKNSDIKLNELLEELENNEFDSYRKMSTFNSVRAYRITPVYFMLRQNIQDVNYDLSESWLIKQQEIIRNLLQEDFEFVIVLLAYFLGYEKLAPYYLETYPPRIFSGNSTKRNIATYPPSYPKKNAQNSSIFENQEKQNQPESRSETVGGETATILSGTDNSVENQKNTTPSQHHASELATTIEHNITESSLSSSSEPISPESSKTIFDNDQHFENEQQTETPERPNDYPSQELAQVPNLNSTRNIESEKSPEGETYANPSEEVNFPESHVETASSDSKALTDIHTQLNQAIEEFLSERKEATLDEIVGMLNHKFNKNYTKQQINDMIKQNPRFINRKVNKKHTVYINSQKRLDV